MSDSLFRIIVIDDNPSIHRDFIKILKTQPANELDQISLELFGKNEKIPSLPRFEIDVASQGQEGVELIRKASEQGKPYSLAFVDIRMPPGWDGIETIKHIWELDHDIQVVICTAYTDYTWEETVEHLGLTDNLLILKKPFDNVSVRQLACALTTKWELSEKTRKHTEKLQELVADRTTSLQQSLALIKSTFESSSEGILVLNRDGDVVNYNNNFVKMFNMSQSILDSKIEKNLLDNMQTQIVKPELFFKKMNEQKHNPENITIDVIECTNGTILECYSQPHKLNGDIIGRILDFRNITKRAKLEQELQYQATHDPLTSLPNRVTLQKKMKAAIEQASATSASFAIVFIDFDRFKLVNDSLSHAAGDELLIKAAQRLQQLMRPNDTLARLGGDEFVVLLLGIDDALLPQQIQKIINAFQEPFEIGERNLVLTISIGISLYDKDGTTGDILLRNADAAMYQAKADKGNNFKYYRPEMSLQSLALLDKEIELRQALQKNEFFLYYQPQFDINNEKIVAVEALIRWRHPTKGILLPIDFIPLAEETGLIIPIGNWVLKTACKQNKKWQEQGYKPIRMTVNIIGQQFKQQNMMEEIKNILRETGLQENYLEIELTENIVINNPDIINTLTELKKLGVAIAIDDFGTGYSSLSYLNRIPLDRLKIDKSFIQHIHSSDFGDEVILRAVIAVAAHLNLEVLAEGVETKDQVNFLKKYNCKNVQGYYYSKPLSANDVEVYLKSGIAKIKEK